MIAKNTITFLIMLLSISCNNDVIKRDANAIEYDEAALKRFVAGIPASGKNMVNSFDSILSTASSDSNVFHQTVSYFEDPLSNPNSGYRNEDLYVQLLKSKINSSWYNATAKILARERLYLLMQNRQGNVANDFIFITPSGKSMAMNAIHSSYTLLYFYNPECDACKEMKSKLITSRVVNEKVTSGELKVLAVYTDKDEKIWKKHLPELPNQWIHGTDDNEYLYKNKIYDLRAIPTIYLLDKNKKVLLKDCMDVSLIEQSLLSEKISSTK